MLTLMEKKDLRVVLLPGLKDRFDSLIRECGMSQVNSVNRLIEWFCDQDDVTRAAVLGSIPESLRPDVARTILEKMARTALAGRPPDAGAQVPHEPAAQAGIDAMRQAQRRPRRRSGAA